MAQRMVTPDGKWTVEVVQFRSRALFRVRRRSVIGAHGGSGWAPTGQVRSSVAEVAELLGDDFPRLVDAP